MSGKSKEEIAFELVSKLKGVGVWGENNMQAILDMYAQCLDCLLYTSPSPRDATLSRMPSSA